VIVIRSTLTALALCALSFSFSCASDYKFTEEKDPSLGPADSGIDRTGDTSEPAEDSEPDPEDPDPEDPDPDETGDPIIDPDQPIAICNVTPDKVRPITGTATWIGSESYDPNDLAITNYAWTLAELPDGSASTMPSGTDLRPGFNPDLAGDYIGRLIVTNEDGVDSEPCETTLQAEPGEAMWVEMFWENPGDDMDLHLIAPGGSFQNSLTDCYYMNCTPSSWTGGLDWGVMGLATDDPSLDLDDISTTGPENVNIETPQEDIYTVIVHDYPGSVYTAGNAVTINIFLDGTLAWTDTRTISGEDSQTRFAEIDAGAGTVTPL
jgi:hypothetical protein